MADSWFGKVDRGGLPGPRLGSRRSRSASCPPEALDYLLNAPKGEQVVIGYRHERGENTYTANFEGIIPNLERRYRETDSDYVKTELERFMVTRPCPTCAGKRLRPEVLAVTVDGRNIQEVSTLSITDALAWIEAVSTRLTEREQTIARQVVKEIAARLGFLVDVGLDYLTIDRTSQTLSGGEAQRIRLATQIGAGLMGVLYILDEPSIGLHQKDNAKLIATLTRLRDLGNTVLVVEHDEETIRTADWVIDIGPGAGEHGGEVIVNGTLEMLLAEPRSITGAYLRGEQMVAIPATRRAGNGKALVVRGARAHNLKRIDVRFPLGRFIAVTGVSGSGKSTLVTEILYREIARRLNGARDEPGPHDGLEGLEAIDKIIEIDQSPIGRTPRSNPATYTGLFGPIRELFAGVPEARVRGYKPGRFSFNVKGGRCENCKGDGILKIEMQFLADVYVPCEVCKGRRYNREALEIHFKGRSIADVLEMTIEEAVEVFSAVPNVASKLRVLREVGLGYVHLGQPATTLSGGEAQRVKLATELSRRATGRTLYLLDEPTTGLHFADVEKLLQVLHRLVDAGQHRPRHRAQPRRDQDGRLDRRPRAGRRVPGRPDRRRGDARAGRREPGLGDRRVPRPGPARRAARPAQRRHLRRRGGAGERQRTEEGPRGDPAADGGDPQARGGPRLTVAERRPDARARPPRDPAHRRAGPGGRAGGRSAARVAAEVPPLRPSPRRGALGAGARRGPRRPPRRRPARRPPGRRPGHDRPTGRRTRSATRSRRTSPSRSSPRSTASSARSPATSVTAGSEPGGANAPDAGDVVVTPLALSQRGRRRHDDAPGRPRGRVEGRRPCSPAKFSLALWPPGYHGHC